MTIHDLDRLEKASIRAFVQQAAADGLMSGRVLDYGAGTSPYRDIIEGVGMYVPFDRERFGGGSGGDLGELPGGDPYQAILCTQVVSYIVNVLRLLDSFRDWLVHGGALVLTYPSAWPVIRDEIHHFTRHGMEALVTQAGFKIVRHELRLALPFDGFEIPIGYGLVATA